MTTRIILPKCDATNVKKNVDQASRLYFPAPRARCRCQSAPWRTWSPRWAPASPRPSRRRRPAAGRTASAVARPPSPRLSSWKWTWILSDKMTIENCNCQSFNNIVNLSCTRSLCEKSMYFKKMFLHNVTSLSFYNVWHWGCEPVFACGEFKLLERQPGLPVEVGQRTHHRPPHHVVGHDLGPRVGDHLRFEEHFLFITTT